MLTWTIAAMAALVLAWYQYRRERRRPDIAAAAFIRVTALTIALALLMDAPRGRAAARRPLVVLDASASWMRGRDSTLWRDAVTRARAAAGGDTLWLVGDSLRPAPERPVAADAASRIEHAVDRAIGGARPVLLFTDGELDDPDALRRLLVGSRVDVAAPATASDAAVLALELPRSTIGGDTVEVVVRLAAGPGGAAPGWVALGLDGHPLTRVPFDSLASFGERDVRARVRVPAEGRPHRVMRAALSSAGDAVAQNDTLGAALDVAAVPRGVFVSTAPDQDSRFALDVLRGTLAIAVRAFYRVAPGVWRQDPAFTPVSEALVREALSSAPLAVIHGDTALFGPPRTVTSGALALLVPAQTTGEEWYIAGAPTSPLTPAYAGIPWDSLAPVATGASPRGEWIALTARQPRTARDERAVIVGSERPRRVVVVAGSGFWRWRFRGGQGADAYAAVWGGVFDWLAAGGAEHRPAAPATAWVRAGEPVMWQRGARRDSVVVVVLRAIGSMRVDSTMLRFPGNATVAESAPMPVGEYEVSMPGGSAILVVAPSREWLPRRPAVATGDVGSGAPRAIAPRLRDAWWAYIVLLAALCSEWFLRRRAGLR